MILTVSELPSTTGNIPLTTQIKYQNDPTCIDLLGPNHAIIGLDKRLNTAHDK